jgi:hypothetical protein
VLRLAPVTDEEPVGEGRRWREKGSVMALVPLPRQTPWPAGTRAPMQVVVRPIDVGGSAEQTRLRAAIECEPNDTPEQAQPLLLAAGEGVRTWEITGGADDIEFFDNGRVGRSGDDWFRLEYQGAQPRLLTAQLAMPGQVLAARIRCYRLERPTSAARSPAAGELLPIAEYREGREANERVHQQEEEHRANICRLLKPGETYFLRVEANAPGYQLQLRVLRPAPYSDPRMAIRQGLYTQVGQVDAWLTNRPRGASVERRIRESGNLLGTGCMSCHTQSGVWGPALPLARGYKLENVQNYWHLLNVMYECLRPTNRLKDAANNTSLPPLDTGDGPAGTRVAGFNVVQAERFCSPRRLHAMQQVRTANTVLQTGDPGGINAAGPGSNVGQVVVYLFAAEILKAAWLKTGEARYFRALEEKARRALAVTPRYTDDIALRLHFYGRVLPPDWYLSQARRAPETKPEEVSRLATSMRDQLAADETRLRALQKADGSWSFNPGGGAPEGARRQRVDDRSDPAPTALAIWGLTAIGRDASDPAVARAVKALLAMQEPTGRWNRSAETGFVTSAYALHALAMLYPARASKPDRTAYLPRPGESLLATVRRVQAIALAGDRQLAPLALSATRHESPLVRYWALIGLGGAPTARGVPALIAGLGDPVKMVRDAASWGLRQCLLDDSGWEAALAAYSSGSDATREHLMQALGMRADAVLSRSRVDWGRLTALLERAMNRDPHPAVRAWATKAAWQWWIWNPPARAGINAAWVRLLERPEANALAENALRYSSHALFIANGHRANASREHQYPELAPLFAALSRRLQGAAPLPARERLSRRLVGIGATFYGMAGGDGGPGQMGYVTAGADALFGTALLAHLERASRDSSPTPIRIGLEGAAGIPHPPLTDFLVAYALKGPEDLRGLAASAVSDPRSVSLPATPELVEPQWRQVERGAREPSRRPQLSDPILTLWQRVNWMIPKTEEQQRNFFDLMIPRLDSYASPAAIAATADPARRAELEREADASWYLAEEMGEVLQRNPDLHQEIVLRRYFPEQARNPLEAHYWLRSVEWILGFSAEGLGRTKDRALQLYLDQLSPAALPRTRAVAIRMANRTALRRNPEVLLALSKLLPAVEDPQTKETIDRVLRQGNDRFMPALLAALKEERHPTTAFDAAGEPAPTPAQIEDIITFRDYVMPELTRQKRSDQLACMGCHGVPGRVPSMTLRPPDEVGYTSVEDLLANYRILQQRVLLTDLPASKLLRKPLNIQDGQEDGHQGGRRYDPTDAGYQILKRWVENQPLVQKTASAGG